MQTRLTAEGRGVVGVLFKFIALLIAVWAGVTAFGFARSSSADGTAPAPAMATQATPRPTAVVAAESIERHPRPLYEPYRSEPAYIPHGGGTTHYRAWNWPNRRESDRDRRREPSEKKPQAKESQQAPKKKGKPATPQVQRKMDTPAAPKQRKVDTPAVPKQYQPKKPAPSPPKASTPKKGSPPPKSSSKDSKKR